jgi:hypothetical protein
VNRAAVKNNRLWLASLSVICVLGIGLVGFMIFLAGNLFSRLNAVQPVALLSPLHANYSADKLSFVVPALDFNVVQEAIQAHATGTVSVKEQVSTIVGEMKTPVPTITPTFRLSPTPSKSPTLRQPSPTTGASQPSLVPSETLAATLADSPTATLLPSNTLTLTLTFTPTLTLRLSLTPTLTSRPGTITPTLRITLTPTKYATVTPSRTSVVDPTVGDTITPTSTLVTPPTATNTNTWIPTRTFTSTSTNTPVPTRTFTPTPVPSKVPTDTPDPYPPPPTSYP